MKFLLIQMLHNLAYVLRLLARGDQQRVNRFYDYQVVHTHHCDKFARRVNIIPRRIQGEDTFARDQVAVGWLAFGDVVLVQRRP